MTDEPQGFIICEYIEGLQSPKMVTALSIYDVYRSLLESEWRAFRKDTMLQKIIKILSKSNTDKGSVADTIALRDGYKMYNNHDILVALSNENIELIFEAVFDNASSPERLSISVTPFSPVIPSIYRTFNPGKSQ